MSVILFQNAHLIDAVSDSAQDNALVIVENEKIVYAGAMNDALAAKYSANPEAKTVELAGKTLMPGMFDVHVHFSASGKNSSYEERLTETGGFLAIRGALQAENMLKAGFTTVRALGDKNAIDYDIRKAVSEGLILGPRVVCSGRAITVTGGHGDLYPDELHVEGLSEICDSNDAIVRAVRNRIKHNAECIKFMATGGGGTPGPATATKMSREAMAAGVAEAAYRGLVTAAHAIGREGILFAIQAGVQTIEHGVYLDEQGMEEMVRRGSWLVPTLAAYKTIKYGYEGGVSPEQIAKVTAFSEVVGDMLVKARKAGVRMAAGTDCGTPFNYAGENAYELNRFVYYGFTNMEAIKIATANSAAATHQYDTGTIEAGKTADLLVVQGDPLRDIGVLEKCENIRQVYRSGKLLIDRNGREETA